MQEMQEIWVWSLAQEDPLEEGMATYSSILTWRIPWKGEPGGLQSIASHRVRHDWAVMHCWSIRQVVSTKSAFLFSFCYPRVLPILSLKCHFNLFSVFVTPNLPWFRLLSLIWIPVIVSSFSKLQIHDKSRKMGSNARLMFLKRHNFTFSCKHRR